MEFDLVALGETMVALAPHGGDSIRYAAALRIDHAGAESNTCVGLARLGFRAAWVSRLGADAAGDRILDALGAERIDTRWVQRDGARPTGLMLKEPGGRVQYYRTGSAASVMGPALLDAAPVGEARAVLVTGVTALIGPDPHAAGLALLERSRGLKIVDSNLRHGLWGSARRAELVLAFVERCDLLLAGTGELEEILEAREAGRAGRAGETGPAGETGAAEVLARRAAALGPREVVVRSETMVGALAGREWHEIEIRRDTAVDSIGAGDAFNAGYIAARLRDAAIEDALRAGARCGAAVTTSVSDTAGFPRSLA
jgi:2-dehydro-3-deoxygluconokinase